MRLGEYIKSYRDDHVMTMESFASKSGLTKGYVSMLEKGTNPRSGKEIVPSLETIRKVADATGVKLDDLIASLGDHHPVALHDVHTTNVTPITVPTDTITIKVYGSVPAGQPIEALEDIIGYEEIPVAWTRFGKEFIALVVKGDSMYPKYFEGDTVIIEVTPDCNNGQDAVVYVNGYDATLKEVHKNDDGSITLKPYNPEYPPKTYQPDKDGVTILGVVKELRRKM